MREARLCLCDARLPAPASPITLSLATSEMVGSLVGCTRTIDQAKAVLTFAEAIAEKTLRSTVALTAGRGRGKSAALGLAIAAAVGYGYSNIFVTSPSPENLRTLFDFVFKARAGSLGRVPEALTLMSPPFCAGP